MEEQRCLDPELLGNLTFDWGISSDPELTFDPELSFGTALSSDRVLLCSEGVRHVIQRFSDPEGP